MYFMRPWAEIFTNKNYLYYVLIMYTVPGLVTALDDNIPWLSCLVVPQSICVGVSAGRHHGHVGRVSAADGPVPPPLPLPRHDHQCQVSSYSHTSQEGRLKGSGAGLGLLIKRTRVRILCCDVKPCESFFTLHCSSSLSCMNEYLAIDSGG